MSQESHLQIFGTLHEKITNIPPKGTFAQSLTQKDMLVSRRVDDPLDLPPRMKSLVAHEALFVEIQNDPPKMLSCHLGGDEESAS